MRDSLATVLVFLSIFLFVGSPSALAWECTSESQQTKLMLWGESASNEKIQEEVAKCKKASASEAAETNSCIFSGGKIRIFKGGVVVGDKHFLFGREEVAENYGVSS